MTVILVFVALGLVLGFGMILWAATSKSRPPKPEKVKEAEKDDSAPPPAPAPVKKEAQEKEAHKGPGLVAKIVAAAIIIALITLGIGFLIVLYSREGVEHARQHVEVMTAGANPVPVGSTHTPQYHGCSLEAPEGSTEYQGSESYSDPIDIPKGQTICDDSFKSGAQVHYVFHHPGDDIDLFDNNGQRRTDRVKVRADQDICVWLEDV